MDTSTMMGDSPVTKFMGKWGKTIYEEREMIQMYIHLLLAATFPIYIGSHASLRRPPSAEGPEKPQSGQEEDDDDDEIRVEPTVEGLSPSDAIMFPILAGVTLSILYFIIKWLQDPALLNKILNWYFSCLGVFGVGKLAADSLNVITTFIFPSVWASRSETYYVDPLLSLQVAGSANKARTEVRIKSMEDKTNPFPGLLSSVKFSKSTASKLWSLRALFKSHWVFRGYLHGVFSLKTRVQLNDMIGFLLGVAAVTLYNVNGKAWWLTNLIGFGFCYGTLQLMSPTTFWTGSLVLAGLFIYDITMVFCTPLMVTVATSLDVPIKLVFPGPKRGSMLGLGDVVLPGIMMALALRFDLYLHYLAKQTNASITPGLSSTSDVSTNRPISMTRAPYVDAVGAWGERFWTRTVKKDDRPTVADGARFKKLYFKASLVGYVIGMLVTLIVLNVYNHAQPALLYLVPGVLIALWSTAFVRGDLKLMWEYTEDGSLDNDGKEERKKNVSSEPASTESRDSSRDLSLGSSNTSTDDTIVVDVGQSGPEKRIDEHAQHVFLFSLTAPKQRAKKGVLLEKS